MAAGTIWKGEIRFGHVSVPVKLHPAVKEVRIEFHLLHKRDRVRLRQQMICASEEEPVPAEEQVKGFEAEENKYILVDPEELEQTALESSRTIEVHEFVKVGQIDPPLTWVKPELVCEVAFAGWTEDGVMRQPVFLRLREDKDPREAVREKTEAFQRAEERKK